MDTLELIDFVGWTSPQQLHVVGVSMGGMISQELVGQDDCSDSRSESCCLVLTSEIGIHSSGKDSFTVTGIDCSPPGQYSGQSIAVYKRRG